MRGRRAIALVIVICLVLVLAVFGGVLRLLTHQAYVEVDLVSAHLRAIAVGELAFGAVVARLSATRWVDRWFRDAPEVVTDFAAGDGTYSYVLRETPHPVQFADPLARATGGTPHQADLLVSATWGRANVILFWRLTVPEDSLDSLGTVVPIYFGFPPDGTPATVPGTDVMGPIVDAALGTRERNSPRAGGLTGPLGRAAGPGEIGTLLGFDPGPNVVAGVEPPGGGAPVNHPPPGEPPPFLPVHPAPPSMLAGMWVGEYQDIQISATDPRLHHGRDYLVIAERNGVVTGHTRFVDDAGNLLTEWDFTAPSGSRMRFSFQNLRTVVTGPAAPTNMAADLALDGTGNALIGSYLWPGGGRPARYTRVP